MPRKRGLRSVQIIGPDRKPISVDWIVSCFIGKSFNDWSSFHSSVELGYNRDVSDIIRLIRFGTQAAEDQNQIRTFSTWTKQTGSLQVLFSWLIHTVYVLLVWVWRIIGKEGKGLKREEWGGAHLRGGLNKGFTVSHSVYLTLVALLVLGNLHPLMNRISHFLAALVFSPQPEHRAQNCCNTILKPVSLNFISWNNDL